MQALSWLPRPLIIFAMIGKTLTPCVQWHGQDSDGKISEEQMLFSIYGHDAKYIECVRADFWRVSFLGSILVWNKDYPKGPYAHVVDGKVKEDGDIPIIRMMANELFSHESFSLTCLVIQRAEQGVLYSPATYENQDAYDELPRHEVDKDLQLDWRQFYQDPKCTDIGFAVERMYPGYPGRHAQKYAAWCKEQRKLDEAFFYDHGPSDIRY